MCKLLTTLFGLGWPKRRGRMSSPCESLVRISTVLRVFSVTPGKFQGIVLNKITITPSFILSNS
jgi:hypothetical protein